MLRVTGNLFSLTNGSSLNLLSGPLVSLSGGSMLNVTGALIGFGGSGGNLVSVTNSFCPCTTIGGIPVSLTGGALASNVSITGAIKNGWPRDGQLSPERGAHPRGRRHDQGHDRRAVGSRSSGGGATGFRRKTSGARHVLRVASASARSRLA